MQEEVELSIVIPTHQTRELVLRCLDTVSRAARDLPVETVVVDDGSTDGTTSAVGERFPWVRLLRNDVAQGFTVAVNCGIRESRGQYLLLLNSDTEVQGDALRVLLDAFARDEGLGVAGAELRYPDGSPQWSGGPQPGLLWLFVLASGISRLLERVPGFRAVRPVRGSADSVEWVTGAALGLRTSVWHTIGPLDERFSFYCQDLDFCLRAGRAGWSVEIIEGFTVVHHHGATIGRSGSGSGRQNPELLWADLVLWAEQWKGPGWAWAAKHALLLGGHLRILGRRLGEVFAGRDRRQSLRRETERYRKAVRALRHGLTPARPNGTAEDRATNPEEA